MWVDDQRPPPAAAVASDVAASSTPPRVAAAWQRSGLPRSEARSLLQQVLGVPATWLLTHDDEALSPQAWAEFQALAQRRQAGEPLAYVLGWREFYGHRLRVTPDVLIPRPETEHLVEIALTAIGGRERPRLLDLGTGSGAIAIALALARPDAEVWATELSAPALAVARHNADALEARIAFRAGSWWQALANDAGTRFDVIVSNPPYIPAGDPHLTQGDLRFEPISALTDHANGLIHIRELIAGAPARLEPGGSLWIEHGYDQAVAVRALLQAEGWQAVASQRDLAGIERVTGGHRP